MIPVSVNYVPVVLRSMSEKGEITRYRAELNRLYLWQEARSKESPGSAGDSGY